MIGVLSSAQNHAKQSISYYTRFDFGNGLFWFKGIKEVAPYASKINFTRSTTQTSLQSDLTYQEYGINTPGTGYNYEHSKSGLSLWDERANEVADSNDITGVGWSDVGASRSQVSMLNIVTGASLSGEVIEDSSSGLHTARASNYYNSGDNTVYAVVKPSGRSKVIIAIGGKAFGLPSYDYRRGEFDLESGTVLFTPTSGEAGIKVLGDGWCLCWIKQNLPQSGSAYLDVGLLDEAGSNNYAGDGVSGVYIAHAQIEEGAFPSPPIKTPPTSNTREVSYLKTASSDVGFNPSEGAFNIKFSASFTNSCRLVSFNNETVDERFELTIELPSKNPILIIASSSHSTEVLRFTDFTVDQNEDSALEFSYRSGVDASLKIGAVSQTISMSNSVPSGLISLQLGTVTYVTANYFSFNGEIFEFEYKPESGFIS